ncbi:MAG: sigma-70 family RNA polymerase sigma factor [Firmicutes bacterium]|nr:sigma-70 family RNA polymerase sigma factor [Bacillota bacterium]
MRPADEAHDAGRRLLRYVRAVLRRLAAREHLRRSRREARELPLEAGAEPGARAANPEEEALRAVFLDQLLARLGAQERRVVVATVLEGRTEAEVARELGISQQRVAAVRRRALAKLRRFLEEADS